MTFGGLVKSRPHCRHHRKSSGKGHRTWDTNEHGWLMFRVDFENRALLPSQIRRVLDVVRAMAPS
jgi:hypothetical protein